MSAPQNGIFHARRVSRSNSTSSSVVTIKKSASLSSKSGPRTSYRPARSLSPDSSTFQLNDPRSMAVDARINDTDNKTTANLNINRWSHSTSSSTSAIDPDLVRARTSSSAARGLNSGPALKSTSMFSPHSRVPNHRKTSPRKSPIKSHAGRSSPTNASRIFYGLSDSNRTDSSSSIDDELQLTSTAFNAGKYLETAWDRQSGLNKYGHPVEGLSVHYSISNPEPFSQQKSGLPYGIPQIVKPVKPVPTREPNHTRRRDRAAYGSRDTATGSSISSTKSDQSRGVRNQRSPTQKNMLSKALAKANTAVLLDNAQNIQGAIEAYNEACELLQQVLLRSFDIEDQKKLSNIRSTYSNRIAELHDLDDPFANLNDKELPEHPPDDDSEESDGLYSDEVDQHNAVGIPLRQESLLPQIFGGDNFQRETLLRPNKIVTRSTHLNVPMDSQYMPPPLSPRRSPVNELLEESGTPVNAVYLPSNSLKPPDSRNSTGTTSWLDTFDESTSSPNSSRLSSLDFGTRGGQLVSAIEAEFDAMNAAVESAYDEDHSQEATPRISERQNGIMKDASDSNRSGQLEADSIQHNADNTGRRFDHLTREYLDEDAEAEEQILEMMMGGAYATTDLHNVDQAKSAPPRESNSSTFSGHTWNSSATSTTTTSGTALSTLAETVECDSGNAPSRPAPTPPQAIPTTIPSGQRYSIHSTRPVSLDKPIGLRDRRLSGQSTRQLKIETFAARKGSNAQQQEQAPQALPQINDSSLEFEPSDLSLLVLDPATSITTSNKGGRLPSTPLTSVYPSGSLKSDSPATPALTQSGSQNSIEEALGRPQSPSRLAKMMPPPMRKNTSSNSLKIRNLSVNTTELNESPLTPGSAVFAPDFRRNMSSSTPVVHPSGSGVLTNVTTGGMYLFEDHLGFTSPTSPSTAGSTTGPVLLEPCPEAFLLRPFWLMRCLYHVMAHPRGGYVTTRLFLPRDIWRVKNVKIKAMEDKVVQCDILTAALMKMAKVDTLDATAVLEELQAFETVLDQSRIALQKKLGNEVGLAGSASVFKNSPAGDEPEPLSNKSTNTSAAAKAITSSWRKLRSKSSSAALSSMGSNKDSSNLTMPNLPMTSSSAVSTSRSYIRPRNPPPTPTSMPHIPAPHAAYMASLARLFDAAQILDGVARQVEDPGLKATSETHVGLEMGIRNASEFFAFYIIRFVIGDLGVLADKFLKRGSEWVMT